MQHSHKGVVGNFTFIGWDGRQVPETGKKEGQGGFQKFHPTHENLGCVVMDFLDMGCE